MQTWTEVVGAFAAGLVLEPVHYRDFRNPEIIDDFKKALESTPSNIKAPVDKIINAHANHHIEELVEPVAHFFVPIFFVMTGMAVRLDVVFDPSVLLTALGVTVVAILGKIIGGWAATGNTRKLVVGWSMVPRGEVGLIFATIGKSLGVVSDQTFSVIVIMVILTTLLSPPAPIFLDASPRPQPSHWMRTRFLPCRNRAMRFGTSSSHTPDPDRRAISSSYEFAAFTGEFRRDIKRPSLP